MILPCKIYLKPWLTQPKPDIYEDTPASASRNIFPHMNTLLPPPAETNSPIGVFDSGVGGLSVLQAIWQEIPTEQVIYLADQAHVPYGQRPLEEVRQFSSAITQFFLDQGARLIVVACNTASAAALHWLRDHFPETPFVGMEPAVKPAAEGTHTGVVGVLATPATFPRGIVCVRGRKICPRRPCPSAHLPGPGQPDRKR